MTDTFGEIAIEAARFYYELGNILLMKIENSQEILAPQNEQAEVKNIMKEAMGKIFDQQTAQTEITPSKEETKETQLKEVKPEEKKDESAGVTAEVKPNEQEEEIVTTRKEGDEPKIAEEVEGEDQEEGEGDEEEQGQEEEVEDSFQEPWENLTVAKHIIGKAF